jgi:hypothetical protein
MIFITTLALAFDTHIKHLLNGFDMVMEGAPGQWLSRVI